MARPVEFPKARHLALCAAGQSEAKCRAEEADAMVRPFELAEPEPPRGEPGPPAGALAPATAEPALRTGAQGAAPAATGAPPPAPVSPVFPRVIAVDVGRARDDHEVCRAADGSEVVADGRKVRCACSTAGREHAGNAAAWATHLGEAVLLEGLDRWYRLGPTGAGFCRSCELALTEWLRESYGDHLVGFDALAAIRAHPGDRAAPYAGAREAQRLREGIEAGRRAALRARDEARRQRKVEIAVLGRVGPLSAASLALCRDLDGLVFELPSLDPDAALLPFLAARAALGQRPAIALLPPGTTAAQVQLFSALALACDADVMLPDGASDEARAAIAAHRRFQDVVRERFRPSEPLLDVSILVSPFADHWTGGTHLRAASAVAAALSRAQVQVGAQLDLADPGANVLVLAGCAALSANDAARTRRHVEAGGAALVVGKCAAADDEGRSWDPVFPEVKAGLERIGEGRVYVLEQEAPPEPLLVKAARELLGRGRAQLTLSGRARLFARAYLDPERKLDVHLVNFDERPAQGVLLGIAGQAAGAGRTGYWFAPDRAAGKDGERISLNPSGFSVSTILPSIASSALLAVPR